MIGKDGYRHFAALAVVAVMLAALVVAGPVQAGGGGGGGAAAAATAQGASGALGACGAYQNKELYNCVAGVLDNLSNNLRGGENMADAKRSLSTAASQLRAAASKGQALSAITRCRAVVAGILQKVRSFGREGSGYGAIINVLAQAARLIQTKG